MTSAPVPRQRPASHRTAAAPRRVSYFPPQHGAWAFIGLPVMVGATLAPWTPLLFVVGLGAVAAFPVSHFATAMVRYPRRSRYLRPLLLWSAIAIPCSVVAVIARPWLAAVGLLYAMGLAANLWFGHLHKERSLPNEFVFIAECTLLVPVMWAVGEGPRQAPQTWLAPEWQSVVGAAVVVAAVLIGSTLHVRSLIRQRANHRFRIISRSWAVVSLLVVGLGGAADPTTWPLLVPFVYLAIRSFAVRRTDLPPGLLGVIELVGFVLTWGAILWVW